MEFLNILAIVFTIVASIMMFLGIRYREVSFLKGKIVNGATVISIIFIIAAIILFLNSSSDSKDKRNNIEANDINGNILQDVKAGRDITINEQENTKSNLTSEEYDKEIQKLDDTINFIEQIYRNNENEEEWKGNPVYKNYSDLSGYKNQLINSKKIFLKDKNLMVEISKNMKAIAQRFVDAKNYTESAKKENKKTLKDYSNGILDEENASEMNKLIDNMLDSFITHQEEAKKISADLNSIANRLLK